MSQTTEKMCLKYVVAVLVVAVISCSAATPAASENDSSDWLESNLNWECANNATCLENVKTNFVKGLQERRTFNFGGAFSIEPTGDVKQPLNEGRGFVSDIFSGNALRIPMPGNTAVTIQRSLEHNDYLEVALERSLGSEARRRGGGLSGGFGGGSGGGGLGGGVRKNKKYIQTFIPMFLAMNALGWMLLAVKAVASLTVKAFIVSKLALLVAGTIVFKKLMDSATEKLSLGHPFDHGPDHGLMMPYNMEYALPSQHYHTATDMSGADLFSVHLPTAHDALSAAQNLGAAATDSMSVNESQVNQVVTSLNNAQKQQQQQQQQQQAIAAGLQGVPKVKRQDDIWTGYLKKPMFYNSAATAAATNPLYFYGKA